MRDQAVGTTLLNVSMDEACAAVCAQVHARRAAGDSGVLVVALDGRSGVGKSTLAQALAHRLSAVAIDGDDFYAGGTNAEWDALPVADRMAQVIDWQRLRTEALRPLRCGESASYRPFDWDQGVEHRMLSEHARVLDTAPIVILDGVYSGRPELADEISFAVLVVMADDDARRARIVAREGIPMDAWHARWDACEAHYFGTVRSPATFDLIVSTD